MSVDKMIKDQERDQSRERAAERISAERSKSIWEQTPEGTRFLCKTSKTTLFFTSFVVGKQKLLRKWYHIILIGNLRQLLYIISMPGKYLVELMRIVESYDVNYYPDRRLAHVLTRLNPKFSHSGTSCAQSVCGIYVNFNPSSKKSLKEW